MGSGHTGRNGRGANRRARRGPPNQRGPETSSHQAPPAQPSATPHAERNLNGQARREPSSETRAPEFVRPPAPLVPDDARADDAIPSAQRGETAPEQHMRLRGDRRGPQLIPPAAQVPAQSDRAPISRAGEPKAEPNMPPARHEQRGSVVDADGPAGDAATAHSGSSARVPARTDQGDRSHHFVLTERAQQGEPDEEGESAVYERPRYDVRGDIGGLIDSLHDLFIRDRAVASQANNSRCGICYLHFPLAELTYRDAEGFYVCADCLRALGQSQVPMVRRQQR